ncbi:MAG: hypothetical protein WHX52_18860 [Anaerolineae bacterium]
MLCSVIALKRSCRQANILIVFCVCLCFVLLTACVEKTEDAGDIAREFFEAFRTANLDKAKQVTVPEQWDQIEEWMQGRQFYRCRRGDWDGTGTGGVGGILSSTNEAYWGYEYQCISQLTPYTFRINDIWLKETDAGWKVYKWGAICETFAYPGEPCPLEEP